MVVSTELWGDLELSGGFPCGQGKIGVGGFSSRGTAKSITRNFLSWPRAVDLCPSTWTVGDCNMWLKRGQHRGWWSGAHWAGIDGKVSNSRSTSHHGMGLVQGRRSSFKHSLTLSMLSIVSTKMTVRSGGSATMARGASCRFFMVAINLR